MMNRTLTYAGWQERLLANLIDSLILIVPSLALGKLLPHDGITMLITFLISLIYYVHFTASSWQATPGKRLLGIHVVRTDMRLLTQRDALERFLAYLMPSLPLYASFIPEEAMPAVVSWLSIFWFFPILITPERVGMHDRLCSTRVVMGKVGV